MCADKYLYSITVSNQEDIFILLIFQYGFLSLKFYKFCDYHNVLYISPNILHPTMQLPEAEVV